MEDRAAAVLAKDGPPNVLGAEGPQPNAGEANEGGKHGEAAWAGEGVICPGGAGWDQSQNGGVQMRTRAQAAGCREGGGLRP